MTAERIPGQGKSSWDLIDQERFLESLALRRGAVVLDLGCGRGSYSRALAEQVTSTGRVHALDIWDEGVEKLREEADAAGLSHVIAHVADLRERLPIDGGTIDLCLLGTVLHDLVENGSAPVVLDEVARVLARQGRVAIVEFKKAEPPPGPPRAIRMSPSEVEALVRPHGLWNEAYVDLGEHNYLLTFRRGRTL
jgi:ubiquinone/menaquinone biosynthesis C-methylase UbiE